MQRFKIVLEYDGSHFCGWQKQENARSVQESVEGALAQFMKDKPIVYGASRTDAGVHALGQVAHLDSHTELSAHVILKAANHYLKPHKISLLECLKTMNDFHARFSAKQKLYRYVILNRAAPPTVDTGFLWHRQRAMDVDAMKEAAQFLEGTHDFIGLKTAQCQSKSSIRTIDGIDIRQDESKIMIEISAQSFIHKMVRNIVGALTMIGTGQWNKDNIQRILSATEPIMQKATAPPCGLYLMKVFY